MTFDKSFPIWNQLTKAEQSTLLDTAMERTIEKGTLIHTGSDECLGLMNIEEGQIRAFLNSPDGREITIYRLFDHDICLFSAACILKNIQFKKPNSLPATELAF